MTEKDGHFELPQELIDAFGEITKQQEEQFRMCKTMLAGFKATDERDIKYMDSFMDSLHDFMDQGSDTEKVYLDYIAHIATFDPKKAKEYKENLEEHLGYKTEIAYAAAFIAREICHKEKGSDGDAFFKHNCWRIGSRGHDWKIMTTGFLHHIVQDLNYDTDTLLRMTKKKLDEWLANPEDQFWMYDFEDELMPFPGDICYPPTDEEWQEIASALNLLNQRTAVSMEKYLQRFKDQYLPIKVKLDDWNGVAEFQEEYNLLQQMLWDYADKHLSTE